MQNSISKMNFLLIMLFSGVFLGAVSGFFSPDLHAAAAKNTTKIISSVTISSIDDLRNNSLEQGEAGHILLKPGAYIIPSSASGLDLGAAGIQKVEIGTGVSLRVGEDASHSSSIITVQELFINGGSLIASGGRGEGAVAFDLVTLNVAGASSILVSGGSGRYAAAIKVKENFNMTGEPKGTVLGGSGEESTAIMVEGMVSINSDGDFAIHGGSGNYSAGLLATKEFSYAGKGKMNFVGGDGVASFGLATFRLVLMSGSGSLSAMGGHGSNAAGIMFANSADIHGGIFMRSGSLSPALAQIGKQGSARFHADSTLTVDVDFNAPDGQQIGKMLVLGPKDKNPAISSGVQIDSGAKLFFWVSDNMEEDTPQERGGVFMSTPEALINGFFEMAMMDTISARRVTANASLQSGKEYMLNVKRYQE